MNGATSANPTKVAAGATRASFFQDIVVALSRVLHEQALSARDSAVLVRGVELLRFTGKGAVALPDPAAVSELEDTSNALAVLKAAAPATSVIDIDYFDGLRSALEAVASGDRSKDALSKVGEARQLFLSANEANLEASIQDSQEKLPSPLPTPSSVSLSS